MPTRRLFIGTAAAVSLADGVRAQTPAAPYDFAAIERRLALPFRHRQAFGAHRLANGSIAGLMLNSLNAYQFDYGEGSGTLHPVAIFYGTSIAMVLDHGAWRRYRLGVVQERRGDPAGSSGGEPGNPYLGATSSLDARADRRDVRGLYQDASLGALAKRKATFLACDNALHGLATDVVTYGTSGDSPDAVLRDLRAHLVPGTLLVPAGVAAINQVQEMKFTFIQASL